MISVDYNNKTLKQIIQENHIDLLFITCAQAFCDLAIGELSNLGCKVVLVIHDMLDEETEASKVEYLYYVRHAGRFLRNNLGRIKVRLTSGTLTDRSTLMQRLIESNDSDIVTVSRYTKQSIEYFFPQYADKIHVFYSPMKVCPQTKETIDNDVLRSIVENKKKYFLLLSADRVTKNGENMLKAFKRYVEHSSKQSLLVTTGCKKSLFPQHVALPFLSSSDIDNAYKHAHALLYPSMFEGFGYPPIEAMRYGKPVLSSNVCSMPEILGDAPIYFSPLYQSSMFGALRTFENSSYEELQKRATERFKIVSNQQKEDLERLSTMLLNGSFINRKKS